MHLLDDCLPHLTHVSATQLLDTHLYKQPPGQVGGQVWVEVLEGGLLVEEGAGNGVEGGDVSTHEELARKAPLAVCGVVVVAMVVIVGGGGSWW